MRTDTITPAIDLTVMATPAPQGSKRHVGNGVMIESSKKVKPWREAVVWACRDAGSPHVGGAVVASIVFTVRKPTSAPKKRKTYPATKPDLSKLLRSTEDALTDAGAWEDDARLVEMVRLAKVYPGEDVDALDVPGARIRIWRVE